MQQWRVRWHYIWRIWRDDKTRRRETRRLQWRSRRRITSRAGFYGAQRPPRTRWKVTTRTTSGGNGNRKAIPRERLVWLAIGGAAAGRKTSTVLQKAGRTRTACRWSGAAS